MNFSLTPSHMTNRMIIVYVTLSLNVWE